ncbi:MAG TPA: hypothetical protein H9759_06255 [Candidatus Dietzia intestinipullorum]|nr:hypothetical protein [Candidatus Dietzia intestinipullorum]
MSARRPAAVAVVALLLAIVLWWLARDVVMVDPPMVDPAGGPPVEGQIERTVTDPWFLVAATVAAGVALLSASLAILRSRSPHLR